MAMLVGNRQARLVDMKLFNGFHGILLKFAKGSEHIVASLLKHTEARIPRPSDCEKHSRIEPKVKSQKRSSSLLLVRR